MVGIDGAVLRLQGLKPVEVEGVEGGVVLDGELLDAGAAAQIGAAVEHVMADGVAGDLVDGGEAGDLGVGDGDGKLEAVAAIGVEFLVGVVDQAVAVALVGEEVVGDHEVQAVYVVAMQEVGQAVDVGL